MSKRPAAPSPARSTPASAPPRGLIARITAPETEPSWALGAVVVTFAGAMLAFIAGSYVSLTWLPGQPYAALAGWTLGALITIIFIVQTRTRRPGARTAHVDPLRLRPAKASAPIPFVLFIAIGLAVLIDLISGALTGRFYSAPELLGIDLRGGGVLVWVFAFGFMVIAQPIAEELIFRGVAYPALRSAFGFAMTVIFSAGLHALFHLLVYPPDFPTGDMGVRLWWGVAVPFLDAVVLTIVRAHQRSTRASIIAHMGFGLFAVLKLLAIAG